LAVVRVGHVVVRVEVYRVDPWVSPPAGDAARGPLYHEEMGGRAEALASPRRRWRALWAVLALLLLFGGWTVMVMVAVAERRHELEAGISKIQALSALQRETARLLVEDERAAAAWREAAASASSMSEALGAEAPELAAAAAALRVAIAAVEGDPSPRSIGALQGATSELLAGLRAGNTRIAAALGDGWDDLMRIALAALALATLNAGLLAYAQRRRQEALGLAREVARTAEALAEARAALREREALARVAEELRASRDLAEAASEAKRRFTATMSHELLTPLNIVLGYAELLRERLEERSEQEGLADLERLHAAARALHRSLRQILVLTEIDDPELRLARERLPLRPLIERILGDLRPLAERQGNTIELRVPGEMSVVSDPQRLTTVLSEVIDNACRFMSDGVVTIRAWEEGAMVRIEVRDSGPGMAASELGRAFEPYFQGDSSSTRAHDGAGLGLTVAAKICGRIGGRIELSSLHGDGTTVAIWQPSGAAPASAPGL
jgi:signal transduction histidine kinase